jgi:hypothetical protein
MGRLDGTGRTRDALSVPVDDDPVMIEVSPTTDVVESPPGPRSPASRRRTVVIAIAVAVVAAVTLVVTLDRGSGTAQRALRPVRPADVSVSHAYDVAPPPIPPESIPPPPLPACRPAQVHTTAQLRATAGGVVGVVTAIGRTCHFPARMAAVALVGSGATLPVPLTPNPDRVNPATDIAAPALAVGRVSLGFSWTGSWCGTRADAVRVSYGRRSLDVALTGPQPACTGRSTAELIQGAVGDIGDAVQSAPPAWRALHASLTVRPNSHGAVLSGLRVTLTNSSVHSIALAPVPSYIIGVQDDLGDGTAAEVQTPLPYPASKLVVPAGGTLILKLPNTSYAADRRTFRTGFPITVTFAIAGVPNATARTTVR